ncbi:hypothetical protein ACJMK2_016359 [Sinanodonta woodiana]|uniref:EF-hand domain-containing protein n=1 Tax=Sinanodonta woodiana TaxID=1069815 RepID=A0ABD3UWY7_SINWO
MRIRLFLIWIYAACHASKSGVQHRSNAPVHDNQLMKERGIIRIRTSQSGQQQFYKGCGIPRMVQYPKVCTEGKDLRHCVIQSAFYHPVSKSGRTTWVTAAPCESNQKSLLTLGDFAVFDKDGSGFVDTRELITASRVVDEADGLFSTSDINKDGFMDMCEFSKFLGSWKKVLDKIRYFSFLFNIPENTLGCIEFISSFPAVQEAENITDTLFDGEMVGTPTTINMLREEDQIFKANSITKPYTERVPRSKLGDQLTTDASDNITKLLFALYTGTPPTKGTSKLQYGIQLTTVDSVGTRKSPSVTETGTFLTGLGIQLTTPASSETRTFSSFADDRTGDAIVENRSNIKNMKMTAETFDRHFDDRQWLSTMQTGTSADKTKTGVTPDTEMNEAIATKTYIIELGTTKNGNTGGRYTKMSQTSKTYSNGSQTWSTKLPVISTITPEIDVIHVSKMSSKENKTDGTKMHDSDSKTTSSVTFYKNQRDKRIKDRKTEYQGTTAERLANGAVETDIRRSMMTNQFQHMTDIMTNSPMIPTTVNYEHITDYTAYSTNDLLNNKFIGTNTSTEMPNKGAVDYTTISNQYITVPEDDRSAMSNVPIQLATEVIIGHEHHPDDANMETLDIYANQQSTYRSVYSKDDTNNSRDSDARNLLFVGKQPDVPITYKGKENLTQEQFNISETVYARMGKNKTDSKSHASDHTGDSRSISTKITVQDDQLDVINRDHFNKSMALDQDVSRKNEKKMSDLKIELHYLDRDSFNAQRKMMNEMKAVRAYNMYWIQRHGRPGFPYRNRPPFMTYPRPQLRSFTRDIEKPSFVPEIRSKQVSFIPPIQRSVTGIGISDQVKGTYDNNLELQTSSVYKSNQHLIGQAGARGIKDHSHAVNETKNTNSSANAIVSKTIEQDKDGFPQPKKHTVQENGIYKGTGSSFTRKYISKTFPNRMKTPMKAPEATKEDTSAHARSRIKSEVQQQIPQPKKVIQQTITLQPKPTWTKSFKVSEKGTTEIYSWTNGDNSAEDFNYSAIDVDSDERSD